MKKFPKTISDYVYLLWIHNIGTTNVQIDDCIWPILDLRELHYKNGNNLEEARHYVGVQICNYLKNKTTKQRILNDYWMNQYLEEKEILKAITTTTTNVQKYIKVRNI